MTKNKAKDKAASKPIEAKRTTKGPEPARLKIEGDWIAAVDKTLAVKRPNKAGRNDSMKIFSSILIGLMLLGCSKQAETKFDTLTIKWENELPEADLTNHCVIIRSVTATTTNVLQKNVESLGQAANILGQYGWKLVSTDTTGWHLQREANGDGKTFMFELYNSQWNK